MAQRHQRQKSSRQHSELNAYIQSDKQPENTTQTDESDVEILEEVHYVIEEEYEQLQRRNRRRLVGAGALVLVAGGLFAAATTSNMPAPKLVTTDQNPYVKTEILRPDNGASAVANYDLLANAEEMSDDTPLIQTQLPKKSATTAALDTNKDDKAVTLTASEKAAQDARLQREKAQRIALRRKQEAERQAQLAQNNSSANNNATATKAAQKATNPTNNNVAVNTAKSTAPAAADQAEAKRKAREDEQRQRKAQALASKAESERTAKEIAAAEKIHQAQLAADKARVAERSKILGNNNTTTKPETNNNTSSDKIQQEKQRAQRIADERTKANKQIAIQAGSFADKAQAQKMQQQLKGMNYSAGIEEVKTEKGTVYRVKTGKFANKGEADNALKNMKDKGVKGIIVGQ